MEAIILAGGLGTRLQSVIPDSPKCLAPVRDKTFLDFQLNYLFKQGITKIILALGYKHQLVINHIHKNYPLANIIFSTETQQLGTGGAIKLAENFINSENFFVLNGDTYFPLALEILKKFHLQKAAKISIALKKMLNFERYGTVNISEQGRINNFIEKKFQATGYINGGIYLINKKWFSQLNSNLVFSFEKEILEKDYEKFPFYGCPFEDYFIDIGIPEDYFTFQHNIKD